MRFSSARDILPTTARIEAYSDGVFAIIVTLLILEIRVPHIPVEVIDNRAVWQALFQLAPKFVSFAASFFTLAVFWVNHHHFFHQLQRSDARLLWYNNLLLFFLTIVPFTTAFLGEHPIQPVVVGMYAMVMCLAATSFTLMGRHAFFCANLVDGSVPVEARRVEYQRSWFGTGLYILATVLAPLASPVSLALVLIVPLLFVIPRLAAVR